MKKSMMKQKEGEWMKKVKREEELEWERFQKM
jgi:hypothetical protein